MRVRGIPELRSSFDPRVAIHVRARPIELLLALGKATAVPGLPSTLLRASGPWAVLRYVWAFEPPPATRLALSQWTREVRFHAQTLLSEHMGIAIAAHLLETRIIKGPGDFIDAEWWASRAPGMRPLGGIWRTTW